MHNITRKLHSAVVALHLAALRRSVARLDREANRAEVRRDRAYALITEATNDARDAGFLYHAARVTATAHQGECIMEAARIGGKL